MSPTLRRNLALSVAVSGAFIAGYFLNSHSPSHGVNEIPMTSHQHKDDKTHKVQYTCPMHPTIISDEPGSCPICGMPLQKIEDHESGETNQAENQISDSDVNGRSTFSLPVNRQQLIGVTQGVVQERTLESEVRASGKVAFDPDLYAAIEEYRQASAAVRELSDSAYLSITKQSKEIVESSKVRLRLLGLTDAQIRQIANSTADPINLILPKGNAWIYAEVYEYEASALKTGQSIEMTSPSIKGAVFSGKILSISPVLNSQTRTFRVRALVPDPKQMLRPDMFINATIKIRLGNKLAIPVDAALHSGEKTFVFVVEGAGKFTPRAIQIGSKAGDYYEVLDGLESGEKVVTSANFLIDSESQLRSALKGIGSSVDQKSVPGHEGHTP